MTRPSHYTKAACAKHPSHFYHLCHECVALNNNEGNES